MGIETLQGGTVQATHYNLPAILDFWKSPRCLECYANFFKKVGLQLQTHYSLTSLESIFCDNFLMGHNAITVHQHGFVQVRSCLTNLLHSLEEWTFSLDNGHEVDVVLQIFKRHSILCLTITSFSFINLLHTVSSAKY